MKTTTDQIRRAVSSARSEWMQVSPQAARKKLAPDAWSKNEILGHLIDSTANNHQRIVRAAQNTAVDFPTYDQNRWVEVQQFNEMNWVDLVDLFELYCLHLCRVIDGLPPEVFSSPCNIGADEPVPLQAVIEGYLRHLNHHIAQLSEMSE